MTAAISFLVVVWLTLTVGLPAVPLVVVWGVWQTVTRSRRWVP